jgi:hypothetical protein
VPTWLFAVLKEALIPVALRFGIPFVLDFLKKKTGIGTDNQVVQIFCEYATSQKNAKAIAKEKIKAAVRPAKRDQTLGGNR